MSNNAKSGLGTTLSWSGNTVSDLSKIGGIDVTADAQEVTNLADTFKQYIPGIPDGGEVPIEGFLYPGDTNGQIALLNAVSGRTTGAVVITFPATFGAVWGFTGIVTSFKTGDVETEGGLPFSATIKVAGQPTLSISASAGLTTPFMTLSGSGTLIPAAAQATTDYVYSVLTAVSSITITPTASAGVITITANGVSQVVTSGAASTAIALGSAGSVTTITMTVQETGKVPKTYTIKVARA